MLHQSVGYDASKHIKGRKRFVTVDTLGLVLSVFVTAAGQAEREAVRARQYDNPAHDSSFIIILYSCFTFQTASYLFSKIGLQNAQWVHLIAIIFFKPR